jgi:predicted transposase YbfD/YdcC
LAQEVTQEKSNEITAIPSVLETLQLEGALVTINAMGCQTKIAEAILKKKAGYLLALKANHKTGYSAVKEHLGDQRSRRGSLSHESQTEVTHDAFDESHGRLVRRRVFVSTDAAELPALSKWPGLQSVVEVETIRSVNGDSDVEANIRYVLSSRGASDPVLEDAARRHWSIENSLHRDVDVGYSM